MELPTGVWEDEIPVKKPFCSGAEEKETRTLKVAWEKACEVTALMALFSKLLMQ